MLGWPVVSIFLGLGLLLGLYDFRLKTGGNPRETGSSLSPSRVPHVLPPVKPMSTGMVHKVQMRNRCSAGVCPTAPTLSAQGGRFAARSPP